MGYIFDLHPPLPSIPLKRILAVYINRPGFVAWSPNTNEFSQNHFHDLPRRRRLRGEEMDIALVAISELPC